MFFANFVSYRRTQRNRNFFFFFSLFVRFARRTEKFTAIQNPQKSTKSHPTIFPSYFIFPLQLVAAANNKFELNQSTNVYYYYLRFLLFKLSKLSNASTVKFTLTVQVLKYYKSALIISALLQFISTIKNSNTIKLNYH